MEMGGYYHGFHHEVTPNYAHSGFNLGHRGSVDQERPFYSDSGEYLGQKVGQYLYHGDSGTARGASFGDFRQGCVVHFQVLEEVS